MAKSKKSIVTETKEAPETVTGTALVIAKPEPKASGNAEGEQRSSAPKSALNKLIDKALLSVGNIVQALTEAEPNVAAAAMASMIHALKHGDTTPADRLVKGILAKNHPAARAVAFELVAWFRGCSPLRWETSAPYKCYLNTDPEKGPVDFDEAKASEAAYYETAQAKKARAVGEAAHKKSLADADMKMMMNRAAGLITFFNNIVTGKDDRKIKAGEEPKMRDFAGKINEVLKHFGGSDAVVDIAESKKAA